LEEWGHSSSIEQETVRSIVEAYGEGRITFSPNGAKARSDELRYAPNFQPGDHDVPSSGKGHPYTIATLASFLGWKEYKVAAAPDALALIDDKIASEGTFAGLTTKQAQTVTQHAKRALKVTGDKAVAKAVTKRLGGRSFTGELLADEGVLRHSEPPTPQGQPDARVPGGGARQAGRNRQGGAKHFG
jgi:hypothetical protein